ncbi:hypothetical protein [Chryseobacterium sp. GP-SGM7]|uniref:hypothetical protein n=1 Tax=Chryseobacterium sp. GP-SGM7 TaxID=3411323 RepID=UPI003B95E149
MKKILYSLLIFTSATVFAQKNKAVKFAVSDGIVGTVSIFDNVKNSIQSKELYKTSTSLPQNLKKFSFIADQGLTEIKLKKDAGILDNVNLANYNLQNNLPADRPVIIEGYEFKNTDMKIFADIAENVEVKDYNGVKSVFITTTRK